MLQRRSLPIAALAIVTLLASAACRAQEEKVDSAAHEAQLKQELAKMRDAIRRFRTDSGRYPYALEELVPKYLPSIPVDPMTGSATTWRATTEETVEPSSDFSGAAATETPRAVIVDVQSGAGAPYSNY